MTSNFDKSVLLGRDGKVVALFGSPVDQDAVGSLLGEESAPDNGPMAAINREEIDAKLETLQVKADARLDLFSERIDGAIRDMRNGQADVKEEVRSLHTDLRSFRLHIITTIVVTAIAIVLGIAAFNATVLSNMVTSFESGKSSMKEINEVTNRLEKVQADLAAAQQRLAPTSVPGASATTSALPK